MRTHIFTRNIHKWKNHQECRQTIWPWSADYRQCLPWLVYGTLHPAATLQILFTGIRKVKHSIVIRWKGQHANDSKRLSSQVTTATKNWISTSNLPWCTVGWDSFTMKTIIFTDHTVTKINHFSMHKYRMPIILSAKSHQKLNMEIQQTDYYKQMFPRPIYM